MSRDLTIFDEHLEIRYDRSTAPSTRRFLTALRDEAAVVGSACACGHTHVPPRDVCPACGAHVDDFEALDPVGQLLTWTTDEDPPEAPYDGEVTFGVIRLEGAQGSLLGRVEANGADLQPGARVEARFRPEEEREGSILDIDSWEVVQ